MFRKKDRELLAQIENFVKLDKAYLIAATESNVGAHVNFLKELTELRADNERFHALVLERLGCIASEQGTQFAKLQDELFAIRELVGYKGDSYLCGDVYDSRVSVKSSKKRGKHK